MSIPISEICQFEKHIEDGFAFLLTGLTPANVYDQATRAQTAVTPRIEVRCIVGPYREHRHAFQNTLPVPMGGGVVNQTPADAFDAYEATMEITVVTNRGDNTVTGDHRKLLGLTRARMLRAYVLQHWPGTILAPLDVRPIGTTDSFIDNQDCDFTVMLHEVPFFVNTQGVWPPTI